MLKGGEGVLADLRGTDAAAPADPGLIETLTAAIRRILTAPSPTAVLPEVLPQLAQLVSFDRVIVSELPLVAGSAPVVLFRWAAAGLTGSRVNGNRLEIPLMLEERAWGQIGFEAADRGAPWSDEERTILECIGAALGSALSREQYLQALMSAQRIIRHSRTIAFRLGVDPTLPLIHISGDLELLGFEASELLRAPLMYRDQIDAADREAVQRAMARLLEHRSESSVVEFRWIAKDGSSRWLENHCSAVRDRDGKLLAIEGLLTDVTERRRAQERIAQLARTDPLTGVANRITFTERLRQAFAGSQRGAHPFAVLYLDLDRFKEINDSLGHHAGDLLLQQVAHRLQAATRQIDVVARLGGDEFAIVQSELMESASAGALADKLIELITAPYRIEGSELRVGVSIGISTYSAEARSPDVLLAQADQALYRAKQAGRGRYRFYSEQIEREARTHLTLAEELRLALSRQELEVYYQPQVELASGRIVGMEALLRWNHPTRGVMLPEDFLPIAEKFGLMQQVGRWVLNETCTQIALWRSQQLLVPVVAINVALAQIRMGTEFVNDVMDSITRAALKPSDIELDVTERVLARATLAQSGVLEELRQHGIAIAIDDFGAQYSSLDYLRTYRVNRLKIARGMVAAADAEPGGSSMIRAILSLARELGVEVVAEGVETESQRQLLVQASAQAQGQGYYYSRAVSAQDSAQLLRQGQVGPAPPERIEPHD